MSAKKTIYTLMLLTTALIWGMAFIWLKQILDAGINAQIMVALRYNIAALIMLPFCWRRFKLVKPVDFVKGGIIGMLLGLGVLFQTLGLELTTPSNGALISATYVIMTPFISGIISKKKPERKVYLCALLCMAGMFILSYDVDSGFSFNLGDLFMLLCAIFIAFQIALLFHFGKNMLAEVTTFSSLLGAGIVGVATYFLLPSDGSGDAPVINWGEAILPFAMLVLGSTLLCSFFQSTAQRRLDPGKAAILLSMESPSALMFSCLFGYDSVSFRLVTGAAVIILSCIWASYEKKDKNLTENNLNGKPH